MSGTLHLLKSKNQNSNTNLSFYHSKNLPKKHNHIFFYLKDFTIIFNDPRRFGFVKLIKGKKILKNFFRKLGPDPFEKKFNLKYVKNYLNGKTKNIKNTLIDQNFISGVGNIYASEILNCSKISPFKISGTLLIINKKTFFVQKKCLKMLYQKGSIINLSQTKEQRQLSEKFRHTIYQTNL